MLPPLPFTEAPAPADKLERSAWQRRFADIRAATLALAAPLSPEDQLVQSMPEVSPTKWHLAHTTWFFEEFLLGAHARGHKLFDPAYRRLFNSYYEAVGERHPRQQRGLLSRPSLQEVHAYRESVDRAVGGLIGDLNEEQWQSAAPILELGLHHEQQHQELILMDIKHVLSCNPLGPIYARDARRLPGQTDALQWRTYRRGLYEIGAEEDGFAFDNERPRHKAWIEAFRLANRLVTNGEYLEFIRDGGYRRAELWLSDGWAAVRANAWQAPLYWNTAAGSVFTLRGECKLHREAPVSHISYFEADAFARWAGKRLPTEQEWEIAATRNLEAQLLGVLWQWTQSPYIAYPRFRPAAGALGEYNAKFMCGQFVLRGGAYATPPAHLRLTYRNFFPPSARWVFSGVRLADDDL